MSAVQSRRSRIQSRRCIEGYINILLLGVLFGLCSALEGIKMTSVMEVGCWMVALMMCLTLMVVAYYMCTFKRMEAEREEERMRQILEGITSYVPPNTPEYSFPQ